MYSIILTNGRTISIKVTSVEWYEKSNTIRLLDDDIVVARFNMDNIAGWVKAGNKVEADYRAIRLDTSMLSQEGESRPEDYADTENKTESEKDGIAVIFAGCQEMLSDLDLSMSYVLESDHRSFTNPETENGWLFDKIIDWRKAIQPYIIKEE